MNTETKIVYRLSDPGYLRSWRSSYGFTLHLWWADADEPKGNGYEQWGGTWRDYLHYRFLDNGRIIFEGSHYSPSPQHTVDSLEATYGLLGYLMLGKGDVEAEYFASYTPEQLAWRDSARREELALIGNDYEYRQEDKRDRN